MKKIMTMALATAAILCGCANEDANNPAIESDVLSIAHVNVDVVKDTRAELSGVLTSGSIGVFGYETTNFQNNKQYTYGTGWAATDPIKLTDIAIKIYAYSPYSASISGTDAVPTLDIADNTTAQVDYLYSGELAGSYSKTNNTVATLELQHALTKVVFTKAQDATYPGNGVISSITLTNAASKEFLAAAGSLDIRNGDITATPQQSTTYSVISGNTSSFKDGTVSGSVMVLPTSTFATGDIVAEVVMDGENYSLNIPAAAWVKGTVNTYTLKVESSSLAITNVEVKDWVTGVDQELPVD